MATMLHEISSWRIVAFLLPIGCFSTKSPIADGFMRFNEFIAHGFDFINEFP